jgi:hypothetical protein
MVKARGLGPSPGTRVKHHWSGLATASIAAMRSWIRLIALSGRSMTLNSVTFPDAFHLMMSTPATRTLRGGTVLAYLENLAQRLLMGHSGAGDAA